MKAKKNRIGSILRKVGRRQAAQQGDEGKAVGGRSRNSGNEQNPGRRLRNGNRRVVESEVLAKAVRLAHRYAASGLPLNQTISQGLLELVESAQRFAPHRGARATSRAVWPLQRCLIKSVIKQRGVIGIPWHKLSPLYRIESASGTLMGKNGSPVRLREEENGDGMVELTASRTLHARSIHDASLEAFISWDKPDHSEPLGEDNPSLYPVPGLPSNGVQMRIHAALENLSGREQDILNLHYGLNAGETLTFAEIGRIMNLSLHRVEHLENQAIDRLRRFLETDPEKRSE